RSRVVHDAPAAPAAGWRGARCGGENRRNRQGQPAGAAGCRDSRHCLLKPKTCPRTKACAMTTERPDYRALARDLAFETRLFIDGEFRAAKSGRTFATLNPATGKVLAHVSEGDATD